MKGLFVAYTFQFFREGVDAVVKKRFDMGFVVSCVLLFRLECEIDCGGEKWCFALAGVKRFFRR